MIKGAPPFDTQRPVPLVRYFLLALLCLALLIAGLWWVRERHSSQLTGTGAVIAALPGDYKSLPHDTGGIIAEGQGESAAAIAIGVEEDAKIDNSAQAEVPIQPMTQHTAIVHAAPATLAAVNRNSNKNDTGLIQIGAFATRETAQQRWQDLRNDNEILKTQRIHFVESRIAHTPVFYLQIRAQEAAEEICSTLREGGGNCQLLQPPPKYSKY